MKNEKFLSRIDRFDKVVSFMEENLDKWNSIDEIRRTYDEFRHNLKKIKDLQPELEQDLSPLKTEIETKSELLRTRLFPVGNVLEVYAQDHKLGAKARKILKRQKRVNELGNSELLKHGSSVYRLIDKYLHRVEVLDTDTGTITPGQDIKRYGLSQSMLDDLNTACHQYDSALHLRKDVNIYRKKIRSKRDRLIKANRKLLKSRLNKLMSVFSGTHPSFYSRYMEHAS